MIVENHTEVFFRLGAALTLIAAAPQDNFSAIADISDGEESAPGLLSFCSRDPAAILVPDHLFVWSRGYEEHRKLACANRTEWSRRSDRIIWRGSTTGQGNFSNDHFFADDPDLLPRVRLCLYLKELSGIDAKISGIAQSSNVSQDEKRLLRAGILGDYISPMAWHTFKFAIDIDGNSNAWSNLFTRLITGCCVLKVASPLGYRQWYYSDLKAWIHYVPVNADFSDLLRKIAWCRANLDECRLIAARGQAFAMARSYETEIKLGISRLDEAIRTGKLCTNFIS